MPIGSSPVQSKSATTGTSTSSTSVTVSTTATGSGNLLLAYITQGNNSALTLPGSWQTASTINNTSAETCTIAYLKNSTSGVTSFQFSIGSAGSLVVVFEEWSGLDTNAPFDVAATASFVAGTQTQTTGSIGTAHNAELVVWMTGYNHGSTLTESSILGGYTAGNHADALPAGIAKAHVLSHYQVFAAQQGNTSSGSTLSATPTGVSTTLIAAFSAPYTTNTRTISPATAALSSLGLTRTITPATAALSSLGLTRTISPATAALSSLDNARTINPATAALSSLAVTRTISPATAALSALNQPRTISPASAALSSLAVTRTISPTTAALSSLGLARTITPVTAALLATLTRTISPATAALMTTGTRTIASVTASLASQSLSAGVTLTGPNVSTGYVLVGPNTTTTNTLSGP